MRTAPVSVALARAKQRRARSTPSRNPLKKAPRESSGRGTRALEWRDVAKALSGTKARAVVLAEYRALGFDPDKFHLGRARLALVHALTRAEDRLELESHGRRTRERAQLQRLRRRLEAPLSHAGTCWSGNE